MLSVGILIIVVLAVIWTLTKTKSSGSNGRGWLPEPPPIRPDPGASRTTKREANNPPITLTGDGSYSFDIVGESHYQAELERIAGPRQRGGKAFECDALIIHEPDNPHDENACAVFISGRKVGHLPRQAAREQVSFRKSPGFTLSAKALIVGGWKSEDGQGNYGVKLDYVPRDLPAGPLEKELYRFMGEKVPRNLTRKEAQAFEGSLLEAGDSRVGAWRSFRDAAEYLQSAEGRENYYIKKPSLKQIRDAYASLANESQDAGDTRSESEIYERLIEIYPDLER